MAGKRNLACSLYPTSYEKNISRSDAFDNFRAIVVAQSTSFSLLKNNYEDMDEVNTFSINGFFCRALVSLADDHEFRDAVKKIRSLDVITMPRNVFEAGHHTREGFRKLLTKDNFESVVSCRDQRDNVEVFLQKNNNLRNRYLVWTEDDNEMTVVEIEGQIDIAKLVKQSKALAQQSK